MRGTGTVVLALAIALAGCPGATDTAETVTPAPVPDPPTAVPSETPTPSSLLSPTPTPCAIPTPEPRASTPASAPSDGPSIPVENGTVNATTLLERHDRVLREHSYRLSAPNRFVQADPDGPSLRLRARYSLVSAHHYVVDGTWYTYIDSSGANDVFDVRAYDDEGLPHDVGSSYSITGRQWLSDALSVGDHRVDESLASGWVALRAEGPELTNGRGPVTVQERSIRSFESVVLVDSRGIVRSVEQRYELQQEGTNSVLNRTFTVTDVGRATVERPAWVCLAERENLLPSS